MIPYGRHNLSEADIRAVEKVLRSDFLTQGQALPHFENAIASYCNAKHAIATNSATSALHLACRALNVGKGDIVWTSPITFVASANCALYCGAKVDFIDIDPLTYNLSAYRLRQQLITAKKSGVLPKVVIPVHFGGQPCDMKSIHDLSKQYGFKIIEDASHAIGARYKGNAIGNCRYSDISIFSFHPVKIITTGEGGMALTNDYEIAKRIKLIRSHGITRDTNEMTHTPEGPWYYQQIDLGYNYRMTEIQAALGISQLDRLDEFVAKRHQIAKQYNELLSNLPIKLPYKTSESHSAMHLYVIRLKLTEINRTHREVFETLRANGVGVNLHYIPIYRQPYYSNMGFLAKDYPESEKYYAEAISLPIFPTLRDSDQNYIVDSLRESIGS